jgi:hypothetical protein
MSDVRFWIQKVFVAKYEIQPAFFGALHSFIGCESLELAPGDYVTNSLTV